MGCGGSKEERRRMGDATPQGAAFYTEGIRGDDPNMSKLGVQTSSNWMPLDFILAPRTDTNAPKYADHLFTTQFLRACSNANNLVRLAGTVEWEHQLVVDERHRNSAKVKDGIFMLTWMIITFIKAYRALGSLSFMNYQNPDMGSFTNQEKEAALFLRRLVKFQKASDVEEALRGDVPQEIKTRELNGRGTLPQEVENIIKDRNIKPSQRHPRILALIRDLMYDFSEPFDIEDMTLKDCLSHWTKALAQDMEQKKFVSHLSFNLIRLIQAQKIDYQDRAKDETSSMAKRNVIVITGSGLDTAEFEKIKLELKGVQGGSDQYSIAVIHVVEDESDESTLQQRLDDQNSNSKDIYDYTLVNVHSLFSRGPSGHLLLKMVASYLREVDKMNLNKNQLYGNTCIFQREEIVVPTVQDVQNALGIAFGNTTGAIGMEG